ncbi:unnamed protein product [Psylliodes chrysocephalus]|uniref:Uncharacterized protein n=1 Tax=Psylliodes chrysocephalus TaxID=3402493 RepID=A0A9P0GJK3_9CUCU|nr:unnamed protein product [Psylliodes chrysocephala]
MNNPSTVKHILQYVKAGTEKGKCFSTTSIFSKYKALGGLDSKRTIINHLERTLAGQIGIVRSKKANVPSVVLPPIDQSETVHAYIEEASSSDYTPMFTVTSELAQVIKNCTDINSQLDKIPNIDNYSDL